MAGVLPLRYCSAKLACKFPTWKLPDRDHVCDLVTEGNIDGLVLRSDGVRCVPFPGSAGGAGVLCDGRVLGGFKKNPTQQKKHLHTLLDMVVRGSVSSRSRVWKRLRIFEASWCLLCGADVLHECHHGVGGSSLGDRVGVV